MAEIRINATGGVKLYDADDSHYAQIVAGTITSNVDAITLGHDTVTIADNLSLGSDSAVLKFGADGDTTLTHTDGTGLTLNSTNKICFNDASQFIQGSSNAILALGATDEIDLTATAVDLNGTLDVSGTSTLTGAVTASAGITSTAASNTFGASSFNDANITNVGTIAADRILGDADSDSYMDFPGSDIVTINTGDTIRFRIDASGLLSTGGETAPDLSTGGLCLNQSSADTNILSLKSSDVAHGLTDIAETDTYAQIRKSDGNLGGMKIDAFKENGVQAFQVRAIGAGTPDTTKGTAGNCLSEIRNFVNSGTDIDSTSTSNANLFGVFNGNGMDFCVDAEGDLHVDGSTTITAYDAYDDAQLVRALDLSKGRGVINSKFDKFVSYNHEHLAELKLVGREKDGTPNHFINVTGFQRLHNGAIWQQYEKHNQLLEAVYDLAKEAVGEEKANAILDKHEVKRLQ